MINAGNWIRKWSIIHPEKIALFFEDRPLTYRKFNGRMNQLCHLLLKRGDRLVLLLHNCPQFLEIFFAPSKIGAIRVPLNWRLAPLELESILNDSGSTFLFFEPDFEGVDFRWSLPPFSTKEGRLF